MAGEIEIMANSDFFGVEVQFKLRLKLGLSILYCMNYDNLNV